MSTPKPCPFCGHVGLDFREGSTFRWIIADCAGCGASIGETRIQTLGDGTKEEWMAIAKQDAVDAWNRRAALAAQPGAVGESLPEAVVAWMHAESARIAAVHEYNAAHDAAKKYDFGAVDLNPQFQRMTNTANAAHRLLAPMHEALIALAAAPTEAKPAQDAVDAERYRWLRSNWFTMGAWYPDGKVKFTTGETKWSDQPESNIDDAIDAAISAKKGGAS